MGHVQRLQAGHDRARMIAGVMALVAGLALFSLARAPGANGQLVNVSIGNSGSGTASTGGNTATGNNSSNDTSSSTTSGGLINASVDLGGPASSNTSSGTADITTGPATATGNTSGTGVAQTTDGTGSTFTPFFSQPAGQAAAVTNDGTATASTGGNTATGNNSDNTATLTQSATGGLIGANVNLGGGATNNSTGTATINTGPATAAGNTATNSVDQARAVGDPSGGYIAGTPFGPGLYPGTVSGFGSSYDPCSGRFFPFSPFSTGGGQGASVGNVGTASAGTGGNTAVGNNSTNTATVSQTASGGLIGLNLNLGGGATNNSTGTATINTGAATASGNQSTNAVSQFCGQAAGATPVVARNPITGAPFAVPVIHKAHHGQVVKAQSLARTGIESSLALVAAALVVAGLALLLPARRRLAGAQAGTGVRTSEWDDIVRW